MYMQTNGKCRQMDGGFTINLVRGRALPNRNLVAGCSVSDSERAKQVETFAHTPSTGGTAIDAAGNIYVSDIDRQLILKIAPDRSISTLIHDPRLLWVDAMWIDHGQRERAGRANR